MLKYLIPLLLLLISPISHADDELSPAVRQRLLEVEKNFKKFDDSIRPKLDEIKVRHEERMQNPGTRQIILEKKNYPVVPYDPNHPNVQKQKSSKFNISAKAKTLAGRFGKGLNAVALGVAVAELIGEGIDWVLDPENNSVVYSDGYVWIDFHQNIHPTKESAANYNCKIMGPVCQSVTLIKQSSYNQLIYDVYVSSSNPAIEKAPSITKLKSQDKKRIPLETVAQHVINNETNNVTNNNTTNITNVYYDAVTDTLIDQIQKGEHDDDIKNAVDKLADDKTDTDTSTENKDETDDKTETEEETQTGGGGLLQFPKFCTWAKPVCDWLEWSKKPLDDDDTELDIPDQQSDSIDTSINASGSCPTDIVIQATFASRQFDFFRFQWSKFCQWLFIIKPIIIAMASFGAVKIVGGVNVAD